MWRHGWHFSALISATAEEICGCWGGTRWHFQLLFNKAWIEWAHSLSLEAQTTCERLELPLLWTLLHLHTQPHVLTYRGPFHSLSHTHTHTQVLAQQLSWGQIAVAEDMCWNHQSQRAPSGRIRFVLTWAEPNVSRAKTGPRWLEGVRGIQGDINQVDRQWLGRGRGCEKANWEAAFTVTDSSFLPCVPQRNGKQLEGPERTPFRLASVLCRLHLWRKLAFCLNIR